MKAVLIFPGTGPILILTSYPSLIDERFIEKLSQKGINKFIAFEVPLETAKVRYGARYDVITQDLGDAEDMRVLDYNGYTAFHNFSFEELGEPIKYEK
jgi:hypothetical protein